MTISIGSVGATATSLLDTLTGNASAQPAANPAPASATSTAAAHHGGHHHGGAAAFSDILSALT